MASGNAGKRQAGATRVARKRTSLVVAYSESAPIPDADMLARVRARLAE